METGRQRQERQDDARRPRRFRDVGTKARIVRRRVDKPQHALYSFPIDPEIASSYSKPSHTGRACLFLECVTGGMGKRKSEQADERASERGKRTGFGIRDSAFGKKKRGWGNTHPYPPAPSSCRCVTASSSPRQGHEVVAPSESANSGMVCASRCRPGRGPRWGLCVLRKRAGRRCTFAGSFGATLWWHMRSPGSKNHPGPRS